VCKTNCSSKFEKSRHSRATFRRDIVVVAYQILLLMAVVSTSSASAQTPDRQGVAQAGPDARQEAALRRLRAASETPTHVYFRNGFPRVVNTRVRVNGASAVERARNFLQNYREIYGQFMPRLFRSTATDNALSLPDPMTGAERAREFQRRFDRLQGIPTSNPDLDLAVRGTTGPDDQIVGFYQTYRGIPVYGAELVVILQVVSRRWWKLAWRGSGTAWWSGSGGEVKVDG
jgi:hypothetical protein